MKRNKIFAVFGLGRFGRAIASQLVENGAEVIAVDLDEGVVNDLADELPICKCADVTDPEVLKQLGISNVDTVIIAMAENLEASVMTTLLCKDCGVPYVIVKCSCDE
ncbi:MAG: TrkA family potassium uptake protein, partial [Clostridia bacterium]|nr:TrkA family potassium uptake protein [Clostridia bacterium]